MQENGFDKSRFREAMGDMSIVDLSEKLSCPKSSISMYLSGQRTPSKMAIQLIALVLGVNPAWLCGLDVDKYWNAKIISVPSNDNEWVEEFKKNLEDVWQSFQIDYSDIDSMIEHGLDYYKLCRDVEGVLKETKPLTFELACQIADQLGESMDTLLGRDFDGTKKPTLENEDGLDDLSHQMSNIILRLSPEKKQEALHYLEYLEAREDK